MVTRSAPSLGNARGRLLWVAGHVSFRITLGVTSLAPVGVLVWEPACLLSGSCWSRQRRLRCGPRLVRRCVTVSL